MAIFDGTSLFSVLYTSFTLNVTGSHWVSQLIIFGFLFIIGMAFKVPFQLTLAILTPLLLLGLLITSQWVGVLIVLVLISAVAIGTMIINS